MQRGSWSLAELLWWALQQWDASIPPQINALKPGWCPNRLHWALFRCMMETAAFHFSLWPGSSALEKIYFFNGGKSQSYIELKVPIMDTCLPESSSWSIVFPVMVPVSFAVCSKTIHVHLRSKRELMLWPGKQFAFIWNAEETFLILGLSVGSLGTSMVWQAILLHELMQPEKPKAYSGDITF